jgi:hypothetical protein
MDVIAADCDRQTDHTRTRLVSGAFLPSSLPSINNGAQEEKIQQRHNNNNNIIIMVAPHLLGR